MEAEGDFVDRVIGPGQSLDLADRLVALLEDPERHPAGLRMPLRSHEGERDIVGVAHQHAGEDGYAP